jgi:long-chain acyl-CoA synthetase
MSITSAQDKRRGKTVQASRREDALLEAWEKTRRKNGERAAILDARGNVTLTFAQIEERAVAFMRELDQFSQAEVIAIQIGNHPDWPSLFLACLRKRLVVLPLEQTISGEQCRAAFETCHVVAAAALSRRGVVLRGVEALRSAGCRTQHAGSVRSHSRGKKVCWGKHWPSLLKLTSGTTATPRAIRFRSEQLLADCENICETMGIIARDLNFGVIPISHSYGFSNLLTPLLVRGVPLALSSDRIPRAILNGIAASGATVFPGMPVFYQSFCELNTIPLLPKLRLCISAGAPLSAQLAATFRKKFARSIHSFYGSSECGGICYAREPRPIDGFVGTPMPGVKIERIEENSASASQNPGAIRVRSAAVGDGYFPEPDEARLGHGVFVPDDLLEKTADGYRIAGRASDLINVAGKKVNPAQIEAELLRCQGVREAIVFARACPRRNEEVVACVIRTQAVTEAELLTHCRAYLSSWQAPRHIFFLEQMPVNERGKISRRELARIYALKD